MHPCVPLKALCAPEHPLGPCAPMNTQVYLWGPSPLAAGDGWGPLSMHGHLTRCSNDSSEAHVQGDSQLGKSESVYTAFTGPSRSHHSLHLGTEGNSTLSRKPGLCVLGQSRL